MDENKRRGHLRYRAYKFYKEGENQVGSGMFSEGEVAYNEHDFTENTMTGAQ